MIEKEVFKQVINYVLVVALFIVAFFIIKPIFYSIIYGILLAYIFYPVYKFVRSQVKSEILSAIIVCVGILVILVSLIVIIFTSLLNQLIDFYLSLQQINVGKIIAAQLPTFLSRPEISSTIVSSVNDSLAKLIAGFVTALGNIVLNIPDLILQFFVFAFVFFFCLKDGERSIEYFKSLSPMKKETQHKFFKHFEDITKSVIIGEIIVGLVQGLVAGIGYFAFGVPNALLLTIITALLSILPIIGPWLIWIPVDLYLFLVGRDVAAFGLLIYGLFFVNWIDNIIRPMILSRRTELNQVIALVGMIGGLYVFGFVGLILGPLVLGYVLLVLELYRKQNIDENLIFKKVDG
ncbi:AI-2E family transporter [Candidatus Pacearchaeota archaeon]|nr:AI-2E family transporter [Candidatus Pacearchaeota archaeon]